MEGLFRGTWYRGTVELKGDKIVSAPPFTQYDPFAFFFSASNVRQGEKSLYLDFLAVNAEKPEEVLKFCQRFGVLGNAEKTTEWLEKKGEQSARIEYWLHYHPEFFKDDTQINSLIGKTPTTRFPPETLCLPQTVEGFRAQQTVLRNALTPDRGIFPKCSSSQLKDITRSVINNYLMDSHVQPQLNWNVQKDCWELLWVSYDLFGYLFIMLMLDLLGPGKVLSCPRCHKFFMTASNLVRFCSPSCYEVFKVQKYQREKKKKELAAQKGKKAKAKKSTGKKK